MKRHRRMIRIAAAIALLLLGAAAYAAFSPAFAATCKAVYRASVTWIGQRADAINQALSQPARYTPSQPAPRAWHDDEPDAKAAAKEISLTSAANRWKKREPAAKSGDGEETGDGQSTQEEQ